MKHITYRLLTGLAFALPLALVTFALVRADAGQPAPESQQQDCRDCHEEFQKAWEGGAHGQAMTDQVFQTSWEAQGSPQECLSCHTTGYDPGSGTYHAEGVTCEACHTPVSSNHPLAPASMSRAASLCGECHRDTFFEWQASKHGQSDLTCVSCHDPHATDIKTSDASALCASCHGTRVSAFTHSAHAAEGLSCTDCHIGEVLGQPSLGQGKRSHSFAVDLNTCTKCHAYEMHNPAKAMLITAEGTPVPPDSMSSGNPQVVSEEPAPVSPAGFALFAGLIGLAFGIVLAPWLERGYQLLTKKDNSRSESEVRS